MTDVVDVGTSPNDGEGYNFRDAFIAINAAFAAQANLIAGVSSQVGAGLTPQDLNTAIGSLETILNGKLGTTGDASQTNVTLSGGVVQALATILNTQATAVAGKVDTTALATTPTSVSGLPGTSTIGAASTEFFPALFAINGAGDDHSRLQSLLDKTAGGTCELPTLFQPNATVLVRNGTRLMGRRGNGSMIQAAAGLPTGSAIMMNENWYGTAGVRTDADIELHRVIFDGTGLTNRTAPLASFYKISRFLAEDCRVQNHPFQGMAVGGCLNATISRLTAVATGNPTASAEGGAGLWLGVSPDNVRNGDILVDRLVATNLNWSAIYVTGTDNATINRPYITGGAEAGIFANSTSAGLVVKDPQIYNNKRKYISGHGIEIGATDAKILGGNIVNADGSCIVLENVSQWLVDGVSVSNARRDTSYYPVACLIDLIDNSGLSGSLGAGTIQNCLFGGDAQPFAAVGIGDPAGTARAKTGIRILRNRGMASQTWASGSQIAFLAGATNSSANAAVQWTGTCRRKENEATVDDTPVKGFVQATSSAQTITVGFRPALLEIVVMQGASGVRQFAGAWTAADGFRGRDFASGTEGTRSDVALTTVHVTDGANTVQYDASLGVVWNGFTLTPTTSTALPYIHWTAWP